MSLEEENAALRHQVEGLETQLVAYDAVLDGNSELAQRIAPGAFEVRRRHAVERVPLAVLREVFPIPARYLPLRREGDGVGVEEDDDNYYLRQVWTGENPIFPRRIYMSCTLRDGLSDALMLSLGLSQPEAGGTRPLSRAHTNIPRSSDHGLPHGFTWLVTSWSLELREASGWNVGPLTGYVELQYGSQKISQRPLSDALRPHGIDLLLVIREGMPYEVRIEPTQVLAISPCDPHAVPLLPPRLYVFLEVIAREQGWPY